MTFDIKKLILGGVSGLVAAILVDLHAWSESTGSFDWKLASKRWLIGLVSGIVGSLSLSGVNP